MAPADLLLHYVKVFSNLRVDKNKNRYTTGLAPHKPSFFL